MSLDFAARRPELKQANEDALAGQLPLKLSAKLDSSLKKNTSFIKKIKAINAESAPGILAEISALSLEKYLSEITASLVEGLLKLSKTDDINAGMLVTCALFQRFTNLFSSPLASHLVSAALDKAPEAPNLKQKTALKVLFEMQLLAICTSFSACAPELLSETAAKFYTKLGSSVISVTLLKELMTFKMETGYGLPGVTTLLKRFSSVLAQDTETDLGEPKFVSRQLFVSYTSRMFDILQDLHGKLAKLELRNKKASIRTGKILAEHQDLVDEMAAKKDYFIKHLSVLCELLDMHMPTLEAPKPEEPEKESNDAETEPSWWHDEKEREFYQEVPSYKEVVERFDPQKLPETEYLNLSEGEKVIHFMDQLEGLLDAKDLDLMTAVMHKHIPYNKATKHRLIRFFTEVKKVDNVNLYARFLKINAEHFPEVISELIESLDRGFRSQIHFDTINFRNLAFFIELVKFKLIPSHVVLHKIRRMTLSIAGTNNVDILLVFYERCGKFLLFEPEYSETTKEMLELLQNQSKSDRLTVNEKLALSNMFLIVDSFTKPPQQKPTTRPELTVVQDFVHQCVKKLVTAFSCRDAFSILRSIEFAKCGEAWETLLEIYCHPEELGADRLTMFAELLLGIGKEQKHVAISVVDALTEKVVRGLELNDYRKNTARISQVKFFAALFNTRVLNFLSILDLLYKIVCFGYPNNLPAPHLYLDIDPPENYFRIHLVCALLKSVNLHKVKQMGLLNRGVKTVEGFLVFLQYYAMCKTRPFPKDIEFSMMNVLSSFNAVSKTKLQMASDLPSAMQSLQQYTVGHQQREQSKAEQQGAPGASKTLGNDEEDDDELAESDETHSDVTNSAEEDSDWDDEGRSIDEYENERQSLNEAGNASLSEQGSDGDTLGSDGELDFDDLEEDEEEEEGQHTFQLRSATETLEAKRMDDEINNLLNTSMHQTKLSAPLKMPTPSALVSSQRGEKTGAQTFKFLKKGNSVRDLSLPKNNQFTERIEMEQAAQKANRQKIMSLVNNM